MIAETEQATQAAAEQVIPHVPIPDVTERVSPVKAAAEQARLTVTRAVYVTEQE